MTSNNADLRRISRRAVTSGIAWTAPVLAATAAAPAFAASCTPTLGYSGTAQYHWGLDNKPENPTGTTTQVLNAGAGQITVANLPANVTVVSMTVDQYIQRREGQPSSGPGVYYVANPTVVKDDINYVGSTSSGTITPINPTPNRAYQDAGGEYKQFTITNGYPVAGSGWNSTIQTTNGLSTTFADGSTATAWRMRYAWSSTQDTQATYTPVPKSSCVNFSSGSSGRFNITYQGVQASQSTDWWVRQTPAVRIDYTVTLSNGTVLRNTAYSGGNTH